MDPSFDDLLVDDVFFDLATPTSPRVGMYQGPAPPLPIVSPTQGNHLAPSTAPARTYDELPTLWERRSANQSEREDDESKRVSGITLEGSDLTSTNGNGLKIHIPTPEERAALQRKTVDVDRDLAPTARLRK